MPQHAGERECLPRFGPFNASDTQVIITDLPVEIHSNVTGITLDNEDQILDYTLLQSTTSLSVRFRVPEEKSTSRHEARERRVALHYIHKNAHFYFDCGVFTYITYEGLQMMNMMLSMNLFLKNQFGLDVNNLVSTQRESTSHMAQLALGQGYVNEEQYINHYVNIETNPQGA